MKKSPSHLALDLRERLSAVGEWLSPLGLRVILAWEFWESGVEKLHGENWFGWLMEQGKFPWPFNLPPADFSWALATWAEIVGALALLVGLGTRFWAFSLFVLTVVAVASVHWPAEWGSLAELWKGYAVTDKGFGNYKLPLLFAILLLPLMLSGPGKLSLDHLIARALGVRAGEHAGAGALGWGIALLGLGLPLAMLLPGFGLLLAGIGSALVVASRLLRV